MSQFLSINEVAALLGKSSKWVYQRQAEIPGRFQIAKSIFFDKEALLNSLREWATSQPQTNHAHSVGRHGL
jgi:predicted DNA-binding transcriptional regulator AlpA